MKKHIIFLIFLTSIVNYLYSFDKSKVTVETGDFYFLVGTEGNERAIMYLNVVGDSAYGSYYTESQSITDGEGGGFIGSFDGRNLKLYYRDDNGKERTITGTLSSDMVFRGKHNSKNVNLYLANTTINNLKIFNCSYEDDIISLYLDCRTIINPIYYNEKELIKYHNSAVEGWEEDIEIIENLYSSISHSDWKYIVYIDDKIIIFYYGSYGSFGGPGRLGGGQGYTVYPINAVADLDLSEDIGFDSIRISDFIANPKDRRLLSLIRNKYNECFNSYFSSDDFKNFEFEDFIDGDIDVEYLDFSISPKGTITIYDSRMNDNRGMIYGYYLWATFTFEELKPFIKKGSVLEYLFN